MRPRLAALVALSTFPRGEVETGHHDNCHRCGKHDQRGKFLHHAILSHDQDTAGSGLPSTAIPHAFDEDAGGEEPETYCCSRYRPP